MPVPSPIKGISWEDSGVSLMARIVGNTAVNILRASISSITYKAFRKSDTDNTDIQENSPLTISSVIFDTLQTTSEWTIDSTGYNFKHDVVALELPAGNEVYVFEFKFTPTSGAVFHAVFEISTLGLIGS